MNRLKKCAALAAAVSIVIGAAGCTKDYGRNDISDYVKETCGIRRFNVSRTSEKITSDKDEYTDYLWTVTEPDGTVFHVLDDYHWGMEALVNTLKTDYFDVHLINAYPQLPHNRLELEYELQNGLYWAELIGSFSSREQLLDELQELEDIHSSDLCPENVSYDLKFEYPYRVIGEYDSFVGDTIGNLSSPIDRAEAEEKMLLTCVDHQLSCRFEFSDEEIHAAVEGNTHQLVVKTNSGESIYYDDLCADQFSYGVSFATLYELLERNGFHPEGTPEHYRVTAKDGTVYEISYSFRHPLLEHSEGMYYLKNNEIVDMDGYFYTHYHVTEIREMFGLEVYERWNLQ